MRRSLRAALMALGASFVLPGCLDLGGSRDPTAATSATTTASSSSTSTGTTAGTTMTTTGTTGTGTTTTGTTTTTTGSASTAPETGEAEECPPEKHICCDYWEQNCPEGEKCVPWANDGGSTWNALKCAPVVPNPDGVGEPCTAEGNGLSGVDSCDAGSMCWDVDPETDEGTCIAFCTGSPDDPQCTPGFSCAITGDGILIVCIPGCDPLAQDCPDDYLCLGSPGGFMCVIDASGDEGQYGHPCEDFNTCDPGLYCAPQEYVPDCKAGGCCSPFCGTSAPNTCPGDGQECLPWWEDGMAPPGFENIGFCGVPQP